MGVVYKGRDPEIGRLVAIKTLKSVFMGDDPAGAEAMERFRLESRSAGKLHHPNIVTIFEAGRTESGSPYIVMEYIEGRSLESIIADVGPIEPAGVVHYLAQIAAAIDYAHSQNVIHRDIKPSNILADPSDATHLLDFGVAKLSDTSLTPAGTVVGTPSYMSPEQIRGAQLDGKTDFFSLAVVAFECFSGLRPFPGNDFTTVVSNIIHKQPLTFDELGLDLPEELETVLGRGLSKERDERYGTALEFISSLADVLDVVVDANGIPGGFQNDMKWQNTSEEETLAGNIQGTVTEAPEREVSADEDDTVAGSSDKLISTEEPEVLERTLMTDDAEGIAAAKAAIASMSAPESQLRSGLSVKTAGGLLLGLVAMVVVALLFLVETSHTPVTAESSTQVRVVEEAADVVEVTREVFPQPRIPAGGFDKVSISLLTSEELRGLLSGSAVPKASLQLAVSEAAIRKLSVAVPEILGVLGNEDYRVRVGGIKALAKLDALSDASVQNKLIELLEDSEALVRGFSAKNLADSGTEAAELALRKRLSSEPNPDIQRVIKQSLKRSEKRRSGAVS